MQNSINLGLRLIVAPGITAAVGDELVIEERLVLNKTGGATFPIEPLPRARQAIVEAGGLIAYTRKRMLDRQAV